MHTRTHVKFKCGVDDKRVGSAYRKRFHFRGRASFNRVESIRTCFKACQKILSPVNTYLTEKDSEQNGGEIDLKNPLARPRVPHEILFAIGGWSAGSPTNFVETYDTRCA